MSSPSRGQRTVPWSRHGCRTLAALSSYFDRVFSAPAEVEDVSLTTAALLARTQQSIPRLAQELIGPYLQFARLLGQHTAELPLALASEAEDARFAPEPFSPLAQRALFQSMRGLMVRVCRQLSQDLNRLPIPVHAEAQELLDRQGEILQCFQALLGQPLTSLRMRCHGNYHLRQVLCTDTGVALIDFEGEPARLLWERQLKHCPLLDVAGMLRSFHYAVYVAYFDRTASQAPPATTDSARLEAGARFWYGWVSAAFLRAYLQGTARQAFIPETPAALQVLCPTHLVEKAMFELGYELEHHSDRIQKPLRGLLQLLESAR